MYQNSLQLVLNTSQVVSDVQWIPTETSGPFQGSQEQTEKLLFDLREGKGKKSCYTKININQTCVFIYEYIFLYHHPSKMFSNEIPRFSHMTPDQTGCTGVHTEWKRRAVKSVTCFLYMYMFMFIVQHMFFSVFLSILFSLYYPKLQYFFW